MNEANLMSYNLFWELQRKCRGAVILDYNPTFAFWTHAKLINGGEAQFIGKVQMYIVDHQHNPFLTDDEHDNYENISDPERLNVYVRGFTGKTKGVIFNFKKVDSIPEGLEFGFGIDIGYTTDKTTIIKVYWSGKTIITRNCFTSPMMKYRTRSMKIGCRMSWATRKRSNIT